MQYYEKINFRYAIIVADSSSDQCRSVNKKLVADVTDALQVSYKEYDSSIPLYAKIAHAVSSSNSDFSCICADDDFIIPDSLTQCANFLKVHPDYSIAHGNVAMALFLPHMEGSGAEVLHTYTYAQLGTKDDSNVPNRLMSYFKNGGSTFYSVYRRANLISNFEIISKNTNCPHFAELLLDSLNCIEGKVKCMDILFGVRQFTPERESAKLISWADFIRADNFPQEYALFLKCLSEKLISLGIPESVSKKIVDRGFYKYTRDGRKARWQTMPATIMRAGDHFLKILLCPELSGKIARIRWFLSDPRGSRLKSRCDSDNFGVEKLMHIKSPHHMAFSVIYDYLVKYPSGI